MPNKKRLIVFMVLALVVLTIPVAVLAQEQSDPGVAHILVANFSPDSPPIDIYINNNLAAQQLSFSQATYPFDVPAGPIYITVRKSGAPLTDPPIVEGEKIVSENNYFVVPVMNIQERAQFGAYRIPVYEALGDTESRVQFFHAVPEGPRMDVIDAITGERMVWAMGYVEDPVTVANIPAGTYHWQVWTNPTVLVPGFINDPDAGPPGLAIDMGTLSLQPKTIYSFYVIGSPAGTPPILALVLAMPLGGGGPSQPPPQGGTPVKTPTPTPTGTITPTPTFTPTTASPEATPSVSFTTSTYYVGEATSNATVLVNLSATSSKTVTVQYTTVDDTAQAGKDYTATSGTLTFDPGDTSKSISVPIKQDTLIEGDERVALVLTNPTNATLGSHSSATLIIQDDDPSPYVNFAAATYSFNESAGEVTVTVNLEFSSNQTITVDYAVNATNPGTADEGFDYILHGTKLTFDPGQTSKTIKITITDDGAIEGDETLKLTLSNPIWAKLGSTKSTVITIKDND